MALRGDKIIDSIEQCINNEINQSLNFQNIVNKKRVVYLTIKHNTAN